MRLQVKIELEQGAKGFNTGGFGFACSEASAPVSSLVVPASSTRARMTRNTE